LIGTIANDAVNRGLNESISNPYSDQKHLRYMDNDEIKVISEHDFRCFGGTSDDLALRYVVDWIPEGLQLENPSLSYLRKARAG
jgi:hypothetical protein